MKDNKGNIIYVGKAVNLKNRVRSYFRSFDSMASKVRAMVSHVEEFEYIVTDSEMEALILENNLIKEYKPPYNILLRDDKTYPYIKVTLAEDFPRVIKTRKVINDGSKYYGPYSNAFAVNDMVDMLQRVFKIRSCKRDIKRSIERKERPCLDYYIKICDGPCLGIVPKEEYAKTVREVMDFLESKDDSLLEILNEDMKRASVAMEYEKAGAILEKIRGIESMLEKQKIVSVIDDDQDFIATENIEKLFCVQVFFIRGGKIVGREHFFFDDEIDSKKSDILESFIKQFYSKSNFVPKQIYISDEFEDMELISRWLSEKKKSKVQLINPKRGDKKALMEMVSKNAIETIKQTRAKINAKKEKSEIISDELKLMLSLEEDIHKIESYDISHIHGMDSVGGQVVFVDGKKAKHLYRRYKIDNNGNIDDYAHMRHIVLRRLKHEDFPDLILLDGGRGHVSTIRQLLKEEKIEIPVFGMYKDDKHRTVGLSSDTENIPLDKHSHLYRFIAEIQEEVHRYAISYHKTLRNKKSTQSILDEIENIGPKRKRSLLKEFNSIDNIKKADLETLKNTPGMNEKAAKSVYDYFKENQNGR